MVRIHKYGKLPQFPAMRLYEGTATVADSISQTGGVMEKMVVYTTPIVKGDYVKIHNNSDATPTVAKANIGDDDIIGIVTDSPIRGDAQTASGTPTTAQMRQATVELFGVAVRTVKNDGAGAINAGAQIGFSNATPGYFEAGTPITANIVNAISLSYVGATAEAKFPALFGYFGFMPNTA